ncbi:putative RND superfamily exporter protein [Methanococcus voltae]|uniref:Putative RND superfamily exporter protein n=1 Tax=Methanococcus voltae TaxID=2188 RepID=A0A8J7S640_METVO|nr:hypothetical protein [Methanococcus voltae]MBP2202215.1 putative RND superfamily exporter protein [Methanococcus voltae]
MGLGLFNKKRFKKEVEKILPREGKLGTMTDKMVYINIFACFILFIAMFASTLTFIPFLIPLFLYVIGIALIMINIVIWLFVLKTYNTVFMDMSWMNFVGGLSGRPLSKMLVLVKTDTKGTYFDIMKKDSNLPILTSKTGKSWIYDKNHIYIFGNQPFIILDKNLNSSYDLELCQACSKLLNSNIKDIEHLNAVIEQIKNSGDEEKAKELMNEIKEIIKNSSSSSISLDDILNYSKSDTQSLITTTVDNSYLAGVYAGKSEDNETFKMVGAIAIIIIAVAVAGILVYKGMGL